MSGRAETAISLIWLVAVAVFGLALLAGAIKVATDFTAADAYRWTMAALFLGGSMAWLTLHHRDTLRRFFTRSRRP